MNWKSLFFLFTTIIFSSTLVFAAPPTDLNLFLVNPPIILYKDLNFGISYSDTNITSITWSFDTDGNTTRNAGTDGNRAFGIDTWEDGQLDSNAIWRVANTLGGQPRIQTAIVKNGIYALQIDANGTNNQAIVLENDFNNAMLIQNTDFNSWIYDENMTNIESDFGVKGPIGSARVLLFQNKFRFQTDLTTVDTAASSAKNGIWYKINIDFNNVVGNIVALRIFDVNGSLHASANLSYTNDFNRISLVSTKKTTTESSSYYDDTSADFNQLGRLVPPQYQNHTFNTSGTKTIQATVTNVDGSTNTSLSINVPADTIAPTITRFDINSITGFGINGQLHYALRCTDDLSSTIDYNVTNNGINQYSAHDLNNQLVFDMNNSIFTGTNAVSFTCMDASGNSTTDTNSFAGASVFFYFVHADTGIKLASGNEYTSGDVNTLKAYSYKLNQYRDMKSTGDVNLFYSGVGDDGIVFIITYTDPTKPAITIDFDLGALDSNSVPVCFSELQPFYEQLVYSTQVRPVKIISALTGCYIASAYTDYAYGDAFKLSAYSIPNSYNMYYKPTTDSNYTLLSLLSGNLANQHNLDLLIINKQVKPTVETIKDSVSANPFCQVNPDCNILGVSYISSKNNTSVLIEILNGDTVLTNVIGTGSDANTLAFTWNYTTADVNANYLTIRATATRDTGAIVITEDIFTLRAIAQVIDPGLAAIIAIALLLFGLTIVASKFALGWFGLIIVIIGLVILSMATYAWYISFLEVMFLAVLGVIFLTFKNETVKVV